MTLEGQEVAQHARPCQRRQQTNLLEAVARARAQRLTPPDRLFDRLFRGAPAECAGSQKQHHVSGKEERRQSLRIASGSARSR